ncbi:hypothetical protein CEXT_418561 [Caerostris extrusa]|uniref:Ycf15 n=1 Tax=Caerostris extrusa TaxID=172846 RepID=A0AAV4VMV0_CAEEX|nr:hypothetical protein CEXT_418561 [Caerostris extrusa]
MLYSSRPNFSPMSREIESDIDVGVWMGRSKIDYHEALSQPNRTEFSPPGRRALQKSRHPGCNYLEFFHLL